MSNYNGVHAYLDQRRVRVCSCFTNYVQMKHISKHQAHTLNNLYLSAVQNVAQHTNISKSALLLFASAVAKTIAQRTDP